MHTQMHLSLDQFGLFVPADDRAQGSTMNDTCRGTPPHLDCTWNTSIVMKSSRDGKNWSPIRNVTRGHDFSVLFNRATDQLVLQYPSGADKGSSMQMLSNKMNVGDLIPSAWGAPTRIDSLGACTGFNVGPGGGGVQLRHSSTHTRWSTLHTAGDATPDEHEGGKSPINVQ